jgi:hypothetical protein
VCGKRSTRAHQKQHTWTGLCGFLRLASCSSTARLRPGPRRLAQPLSAASAWCQRDPSRWDRRAGWLRRTQPELEVALRICTSSIIINSRMCVPADSWVTICSRHVPVRGAARRARMDPRAARGIGSDFNSRDGLEVHAGCADGAGSRARTVVAGSRSLDLGT